MFLPNKHQGDLNNLDMLEIYKLKLTGEIEFYPTNFWTKENADDGIYEILKYLFEDVVKLNDSNLPLYANNQFFRKYHLYGLVKQRFNGSVYKLFDFMYPNRFDFKELFIKGKATTTTRVRLMKWLIEDKLKWNDEDIKNKLSKEVFVTHGILQLLQNEFCGCIHIAINTLYPNRFKPWDLKQLPRDYWTDGHCIDAIKWLVEQKLKLTPSDDLNIVEEKDFVDNNLNGMLYSRFNGSFKKALGYAYPNAKLSKRVRDTHNKNLSKEEAIDKVKWLLETKLRINMNNPSIKITVDIFKENDLFYLLYKFFNSSPYCAINSAYPNRFKPWEITNTPNDFWNKDTITDALNWLYITKLKWSREEAIEKTNRDIFVQNRLLHLFRFFEGDVTRIVDIVFPVKSKKVKSDKKEATKPKKETVEPKKEAVKPKIVEPKKKATKPKKEVVKPKKEASKPKKEAVEPKKEAVEPKVIKYIKPEYQIDKMKPLEVYNLILAGELEDFPSDYWKSNFAVVNALQISKFIIENYLHLNRDTVKGAVTLELLYRLKLESMMKQVFNNSVFRLINTLYPRTYLESDFKDKSNLEQLKTF